MLLPKVDTSKKCRGGLNLQFPVSIQSNVKKINPFLLLCDVRSGGGVIASVNRE